MKDRAGLMLMAVVVALFAVGVAFAEEKAKGPSCQEQLNETKVQAYNLDQDRDLKERTLAKAQTMIYGLQEQNAQLQKQIVDMKKAMEPKGETKKAE
jgi:hypothetical protein